MHQLPNIFATAINLNMNPKLQWTNFDTTWQKEYTV